MLLNKHFNATFSHITGLYTSLQNVVDSVQYTIPLHYKYIERGIKHYELTNHLGNVLAVISDQWRTNCMEVITESDTTYTFQTYIATVTQATDYAAFGAPLPGRTFRLEEDIYRFTFNGKEAEPIFGEGFSDFGARIYDGRLGRWFSVDPKFYEYSDISPFVFAGNSPIWALDLDGERIIIYGARYGFLGLKRHKYEYTPGSVAPPDANQFVKDAFEALNYVYQGDESGIIDRLVVSKKKIKIIETKKLNKTKYNMWNRSIRWNSRAAVVIYNDQGNPTDKRQTPALGLYHELAHDFIRETYSIIQKLKLALTNVDKRIWTDANEKEVIEKYESKAAKKLGEYTRSTHVGVDVKVSGPTKTN